MSKIIGIDVGGTKIAAGLVEFPDGIASEKRTIPTRSERGGPAILADVRALSLELKTAATNDVAAIGLGICEIVDLAGEIRSSNCIDWRGLAPREELSKMARTFIEADVRAAARAEAMFGAGRGYRIFLYVAIGTGISCCLMIDGEPYAGARGATGTMASSPLPSLKHESVQPTLEQIASGPALVARFNSQGGSARTGQEVTIAAQSGNARAMEVVRSAAHALGASIGGLVNVLDPEAVILGGGLGLSEGLFRDSLIVSTRKHIWSDLHRDLPVRSAELGTDAGWMGAAAAAHAVNGGARLGRG